MLFDVEKVIIWLDIDLVCFQQPLKPRGTLYGADEFVYRTDGLENHYELRIVIGCRCLQLDAACIERRLQCIEFWCQAITLAFGGGKMSMRPAWRTLFSICGARSRKEEKW